MGMAASLCVFRETCGSALALEHNGDLYSCDHYVYPENLLGNIMEDPLGSLVTSPSQIRFGQDKRDRAPPLLPRVRGPVRLQRRMPQAPLHPDSPGRSGAQLPLRRIQALLQPHRPLHAFHGGRAAPGTGAGQRHGLGAAAGSASSGKTATRKKRSLPLRKRQEVQEVLRPPLSRITVHPREAPPDPWKPAPCPEVPGGSGRPRRRQPVDDLAAPFP